MEPLTAVKVFDLKEEFQLPELLSETGFEAAVDVLDQNKDGFIDDFEIFDVLGVERSCQEYMTMLGFDGYPQLVPQTRYYGECPLNYGEYSPANKSPLIELDTCSTVDNKAHQDDAQMALDSLMSLSFYLRSNRDVIQELESDSLYFQCVPEDEPLFGDEEKSAPQSLVSNNKIIKRKEDTVIIAQTGEHEEKSVPDEKDEKMESSDPTEKKALETYEWLTTGYEPDPELLEYIQDVCKEARLKDPDRVMASTRAILSSDSLNNANPIDKYLSEDIARIFIIDCL